MKKTLIMLSLCALFFGCTKNWGTPTTRNYPINAVYTGLNASHAFQVTESNEVTDVVVTVGDLAQERVIVEVKNGKLFIGFKPNTMYNGTAYAIIPTSVLRDLELSGASSFTGDLSGDDVDIDLSGASSYRGNVTADEIDMDLSGASSYTGNATANKLSINLSGASNVTVDGSCQNTMKIGLSGGSQLNASALNASAIHGNMSGGSTANVTCCSSLNVELSGGSTLIYGTISDDCHPVVNCPCSGGSMVRTRP